MEVVTRAPGKVILAGEHAVVHGAAAVAATIALYTRVSYLRRPLENDNDLIELELKDTGLLFSWPLQRVEEALNDICPPTPSSPRSFSQEQIEAITSLVEEHNVPEAKIGICSGVAAFLYLYTSIQGIKPGKVAVTSELPLGAGLGSSASFSVSLAAAFLALSGTVCLDSKQEGWLMLRENELELVNKWAFEGEKIIHGKPSGIDNTVSTFASRYPDAMAAVFNAVDSISKEVTRLIESPTPEDVSTTTTREEKLGELMEMNQGLLQCMGVSHASIETVLGTTLRYKLTSKLTGAGGGGCVLTLVPTLLSNAVADKVVSELESCGFQCFKAEVGGGGLEICFR